MKFFTGRQLLRQATSLPLVEIQFEDLHASLDLNERNQQVSATSSNNVSVTQQTKCQTPLIFRKPISPLSFCPTPLRTRNRLVNSSFSKPSSPRTPCLGRKRNTVCASPLVKLDHSHGHGSERFVPPTPFIPQTPFVPPTPMIVNSVEMLSCTAANVDALGVIPDILEIIDDETHPTDTVDLQLKLLSDTVLNDDTVVDYLLDLSQEVKQRHTHKTNTPDDHPERGCVRKKNRHTKLMSEEEREALKRIQKEKSHQKRKQRFREPPVAGTRRSKRIRRPVRC